MKSTPNKILIVDDSDEVRSIVRIFLERDATFHVCGEAGTGPEAIKKAQELQPDLVLLDLKLPGMTGIETASVLKNVLPKTKLVLFSAYTDAPGGRAWASAVGVDLVLPKGSLIDMAQSLKALAAESA
jgi:two-component system, NarL family, nitrate/nitrite response regulator NarL